MVVDFCIEKEELPEVFEWHHVSASSSVERRNKYVFVL